MPVVQNTARDAAGDPCRATVTIRLIAGDLADVNVPGFTVDGTVIGTSRVHTADDGFWSADLLPNTDYLPTGTFYEIGERPAGTRVTFVYYADVPDVAGPVDLVGIIVDPVAEPDSLYLLATQKGASGGLATLDSDGQVPASQLGNASGGGGGGAVASVFGRTGVVVAQTGDYTKAQVGLSNVDNTADASKPVSTAQALADTAIGTAAAGALAAHTGASTSVHGITDTAALATTSSVTTAISTHAAAVDPHGDRAFATAAVTTHETDTTAVHGIANTANLVLTNDARLTDARTPTAHAASHGTGQSDAVTLATSQVTGLDAALAARQPLDSDLTTIAGLTATTDNVIQSVAGSWASRTMAQLKTALGLVKADVGLPNVDNTADTAKPVSTATQAALDAKQPLDTDLTTIAGLTATTDNMIQGVASAWASRTPAQVKTALALDNVTNTTDANKPVSTAMQTALNLKADLASPTFTGTPTLPTGTVATTQIAGNSSTALATTAFVTTADNLKAPLASPTFTGTPSLPTGTTGITQTAGNNTTALATTAFVTAAAALKADLASPTFTGTPTLPTGTVATTQTVGTNTTAVATTAFVQTAAGLLVPKSTVTAKGDLIAATASGTVTALPVGADTFVLTADSTQATGVKWAAASGGSSGGSGVGASINPKGGRWQPIPVGRAGSNYTPVINRLHLIPLPIGPTARQITGVSFEIATAAAAGGLGRACLFSSLTTWEPNIEVVDWGTKVTTGTGALTWTGLTQNVSADTLYWIGFNPTVAAPVMRGVDGYNPYVNLTAAVTGTTSFGMFIMNTVSASTGASPFVYFDVDLAIRASVQFA